MKTDSFKSLLLAATAILLLAAGNCSPQKDISQSPHSNFMSADNADVVPAPVAKEDIIYAEPLNLETLRFVSSEERMDLFRGAESLYKNWKNNPADILEKSGVKDGDYVADIGAAYGFFTFPLSRAVGKTGRVFSTDINSIPLEYQLFLRKETAKKHGDKGFCYDNISVILNDPHDLTLSENLLDKAFLINVHIYHFDPKGEQTKAGGRPDKESIIREIKKQHGDFTRSVARSIKPGGYYIIIENLDSPEAVMDKEDVVSLMKEYGFELHKDYSDNSVFFGVFINSAE